MSEKARGLLSPINVIVLTVLVDMTGFGIIIPLIPFYVQKLGSGPSGIGVLLASFSVMQLLFSPLLGRVSDSRGRRPVLLFSILTSIGSFAIFTLAESYLMLLLSRLIAGLATEGAVAQAYVADITTEEERSKGIGMVGAATGVGFILGPVLGGLLSPYGLRVPGYAAVLLGVLNLVFILFFLPEPERLRNAVEPRGLAESLSEVLDAVRAPLTGQVLTIFFVITLSFAAIPVIVPLLAIDFYGFTEVEMSYVFIFIGLVQVFLQGFAMSRLVRKLGEEKLIVFGPLLMLCGVLMMPMLRGLGFFGLSLVLVSVGVGLTNTSVPSFMSLMSPPDKQGGVLGVTQSVGSVARIPGPLIGGVAVEFGGIGLPFYVSTFLLLIPFLLGCRVFRACTIRGLLEPPSSRRRFPGGVDRPFH
jgi:DHA1 family tetracycline resistance protein-like MFS transporter